MFDSPSGVYTQLVCVYPDCSICFLPLPQECLCLTLFPCVFVFILCPSTPESSVLMQDESRSLGGEVAINMDSHGSNNPLQLQLIDEQVDSLSECESVRV